MSYSGDAAEQVVRMSLETGEVAIKLAGSGAKEIAVLLYSILKDQKRTRGKVRMESMIRSGKELKVFAVKDEDLERFCKEAKQYGVLYCVLKDRDANDGITDIMVRAEDAGKINRIFERFKLSTVDMASIRESIEKSRESRTEGEGAAPESEAKEAAAEEPPVYTPPESGDLEEPVYTPPLDTEVEPVFTFREKDEEAAREKSSFLDALFGPTDTPQEETQKENPTQAGTGVPRQSEPTSESKAAAERGTSEDEPARGRPSVRRELREIREEQRRTAETAPAPGKAPLSHIEPRKKYKTSVKEI